MEIEKLDKQKVYIRSHWVKNPGNHSDWIVGFNEKEKKWVYYNYDYFEVIRSIKIYKYTGDIVSQTDNFTEYTGVTIERSSDSLRIILSKEKIMKKSKDYIGKAKIVIVQYATNIDETINDNTNGYAFKCEPKIKIKSGDFAVVDGQKGLEIVLVKSVLDDDTDVAYHVKMARYANAWIVNKVKTKSHVKRIANSKKLSEIDAELEELTLLEKKKIEIEKEIELLANMTNLESISKRREKLLNL